MGTGGFVLLLVALVSSLVVATANRHDVEVITFSLDDVEEHEASEETLSELLTEALEDMSPFPLWQPNLRNDDNDVDTEETVLEEEEDLSFGSDQLVRLESDEDAEEQTLEDEAQSAVREIREDKAFEQDDDTVESLLEEEEDEPSVVSDQLMEQESEEEDDDIEERILEVLSSFVSDHLVEPRETDDDLEEEEEEEIDVSGQVHGDKKQGISVFKVKVVEHPVDSMEAFFEEVEEEPSVVSDQLVEQENDDDDIEERILDEEEEEKEEIAIGVRDQVKENGDKKQSFTVFEVKGDSVVQIPVDSMKAAFLEEEVEEPSVVSEVQADQVVEQESDDVDDAEKILDEEDESVVSEEQEQVVQQESDDAEKVHFEEVEELSDQLSEQEGEDDEEVIDNNLNERIVEGFRQAEELLAELLDEAEGGLEEGQDVADFLDEIFQEVDQQNVDAVAGQEQGVEEVEALAVEQVNDGNSDVVIQEEELSVNNNNNGLSEIVEEEGKVEEVLDKFSDDFVPVAQEEEEAFVDVPNLVEENELGFGGEDEGSVEIQINMQVDEQPLSSLKEEVEREEIIDQEPEEEEEEFFVPNLVSEEAFAALEGTQEKDAEAVLVQLEDNFAPPNNDNLQLEHGPVTGPDASPGINDNAEHVGLEEKIEALQDPIDDSNVNENEANEQDSQSQPLPAQQESSNLGQKQVDDIEPTLDQKLEIVKREVADEKEDDPQKDEESVLAFLTSLFSVMVDQ